MPRSEEYDSVEVARACLCEVERATREYLNIFRQRDCADFLASWARLGEVIHRTVLLFNPASLGSNCEADRPRAIQVGLRQSMRRLEEDLLKAAIPKATILAASSTEPTSTEAITEEAKTSEMTNEETSESGSSFTPTRDRFNGLLSSIEGTPRE